MALKNPLRATFETIVKDNFKTNPLITKENRPKVKNVIGKDKSFNIGFTVELSKPNITVRINNDFREPIYILSTKFETTYKDIALIIINNDIFLIFNILSLKPINIIWYYTIRFMKVSIFYIYRNYILTMI